MLAVSPAIGRFLGLLRRARTKVAGCLSLCTLMAALPAYAVSAISPEELVRNYTTTLAKQQKFALRFTDKTVRDVQAVSPIMKDLDGRTTYYSSGEVITDGRRVACRMSKWGQFFGRDQPISASNPHYRRHTFDGREQWSYDRNPQHKGAPWWPHGTLTITRNPPHRGISDAITIGYNGHYLLGYINCCAMRMDHILHDRSTRLSLRNEPEVIDGVGCYVLDVSSKYGRGTIWLDPEHGYNIAQAYFNIRSGDIVGGRPVAAGCDAHYYLKDVTFQLADGVWFPTEGTIESRSDLLLGDREAHRYHHKITDLKLNPDMDAMNAFSTADIPNGTQCSYMGSRATFIWQSGRLVPAGRW